MRVSAGRSIASAVALVAVVLAVDASARQALDGARGERSLAPDQSSRAGDGTESLTLLGQAFDNLLQVLRRLVELEAHSVGPHHAFRRGDFLAAHD